ncbi:MAG: hypothetical protein IKU84_05820 [Clostridia bacterium]|nr:hypothetical protein [Clostridia bacterium]
MEFKKKLKTRLYTSYVYIALGVMLMVGGFIIKTEDSFFSSFGFVMVIMGIVRMRNYRIITKDNETVRKQEIAENDERTIAIIRKAKSSAFSIYIMIACVTVIVLSVLKMHDIARLIGSTICFLLVIYWILYWIYQKKN